MEKTLFGFIWKYSKQQQIALLLVTLTLFPFLYLTLELPKRIINDAIGAGQAYVDFFGLTLSQAHFLWLLCFLFLLSVLGHGLLKVRINTLKGALAERLLRRFRYQLVTRMFRFPKPFFQRTSQAEIVSMVTAEAEPLGGMMGDAISQPILQAGQMLTILAFLFLQSFWFGLAAVALIPLQAWLIPILQRRINKLNKQRIGEVRKLAAEIGETAAGTTALRTSGAYSHRAAQLTHRLGRLFFIRLDIYKKKFFMKFLNNFITQLTPFFFFSIGGYLVIQGNISLGALVAALAAYKDLSAPWKELLAYYNRFHEMSQRWDLITEHFAPDGTIDKNLIDGHPDHIEHLTGDIVFENVSAHAADGLAVVENLSMTFPAGGMVAIACSNEEERRAIAQLLSRELLPSSGRITIGGRDLSTVHQAVIGARIGWADSTPYLFAGTIEENMMLPLRSAGISLEQDSHDLKLERLEAQRAGNSAMLLEDNWIDPARVGLADLSEVRKWWLNIIEGIGVDQELVNRGLGLVISPLDAPVVTHSVVHLRKEVRARLHDDGLSPTLRPFDRSTYNTALPLIENILFATAKVPMTQASLAKHPDFLPLLRDLELEADVSIVAHTVVELLFSTFGADGTDHPLFSRLGIDADDFDATLKLSARAKKNGLQDLKDRDLALLLALPCLVMPDQIGQFVPEAVQKQIVEIRPKAVAEEDGRLSDIYQTLNATNYISGLTLMENAIFGALNQEVGARADLLYTTVAAVLAENGLKSEVAMLTLQEQTLLGGTNLPPRVQERVAFTRGAIKRPDILVFDKVLASHDTEARMSAINQLRVALPKACIIQIENTFESTQDYDVVVTIKRGKITQDGQLEPDTESQHINAPDLATKLQTLRQSVFFADLDQKQLRLLAFAAQWFDIPAGRIIFEKGDDPTSGVYLIKEGEADFNAPAPDGSVIHIRTAGPGSLVGELGLILGVPRTLDMVARTNLSGLRIGGEEFLSVVHNDAETAFKLMQLIAGYLSKTPSQTTDD